MTGGDSSGIKLNGQSCSSQGYQMAETQSECESIATYLGLSDTTAELETGSDCDNQTHYRCSYDASYGLYWDATCADNDKDSDNFDNLCLQSGNLNNVYRN